MLFVIPTFNRLGRLEWTLRSLLQAKMPAGEPLRVCIANNAPGTASAVAEVVERAKAQPGAARAEWTFLNREKTLPPVENWYSAIKSQAKEGEVVFLHGDDDLLLPGGAAARQAAAASAGADMLMSRSLHSLYFLPGDERVYPSFGPAAGPAGAELSDLGWEDIDGWGPAFMGNHCYRYTPKFREALELSFKWCDKQEWLDWNTRALMLPYYLPFAVKLCGGRLLGLDSACVIRGTGLEETLKAPFGVPTWNPGFISLCATGVMSNRDLAGIGGLRTAHASLQSMASDWFLTYFIDKRIKPETRKETFKRLGLPTKAFFPASLMRGVSLIALGALGLRNLRVRLKASARAVPAADYLREILGKP
ncbi:MAG: glycosyltransferase family A protein [Elusimicrobiales bacterium]